VITLTPEGAKTHAKAQRLIAAELETRIGDALPARELNQLHRAMAKLRAALAQSDEVARAFGEGKSE
jgi:DNA-binding MarR family transcriptional regulator